MSISPILTRIDTLIHNLLQQLVEQTRLLSSSPSPSSSTSSSSQSTQSSSDDSLPRPAKRRRESSLKPQPLTLLTFPPPAGDGGEVKKKTPVNFPTKSAVGVRRFAQYLKILELVQINLKQGTIVTKRDIYYTTLSSRLFPSQQSSDRIIDQVCALLGCADRSELGIVASPRGLFSGSLTLSPPSGQGIVQCFSGVPNLIPTEINAETWRATLPCTHEAEFCIGHVVVVVEKEAVFKHLIQHPTLARQWVVVTGKGYPDHATRALIQILGAGLECEKGGGVRMVGVFDCDPYGVDIHRQYVQVFGGVEWVGVELDDFLAQNDSEEGGEEEASQLVQLRADERAKAVRMLRTLTGTSADEELWRKLTNTLLTGYKVEIEAAYTFAVGGLVAYLQHKLSTRQTMM
ncbi:related to meiotic recombination protein SPO11 [Ustilago sp. UG-2017a]|nr:related to meiotic recombination protein SPO11 [Ustilago sp. UG-2017a]